MSKKQQPSSQITFILLISSLLLELLLFLSFKLEVFYFNVPFSVSSLSPTNATGLAVFATTQVGYLDGNIAPGYNAAPSCKDNFDASTCAEATYSALFLLASMVGAGILVLLRISLLSKRVSAQFFLKINGGYITVAALTFLTVLGTFIASTLAGEGAKAQLVGTNYRNILRSVTTRVYSVGNSTLATNVAQVSSLSEGKRLPIV
jgi:hypothetical protein